MKICVFNSNLCSLKNFGFHYLHQLGSTEAQHEDFVSRVGDSLSSSKPICVHGCKGLGMGHRLCFSKIICVEPPFFFLVCVLSSKIICVQGVRGGYGAMFVFLGFDFDR